jgi:hypothetical protein
MAARRLLVFVSNNRPDAMAQQEGFTFAVDPDAFTVQRTASKLLQWNRSLRATERQRKREREAKPAV